MKKFITFGAGVLVGAVMFGGSLAIAAGVTANPTQSRVFVNGAEVKLEAYNIGGNNFFKLRDIGNEADFSVVWDGDGQRILINTSREYDANETYKPQTTEAPTPPAPNAALSVKDRITVTPGKPANEITLVGEPIPGKLANGEDISDESIAEMLSELESVFPDGTIWGALGAGNDYYYINSLGFISGSGCTSWAHMTAELLFGIGAKYTSHSDMSKVKAGDIVLLKDADDAERHWFVVRGISDNLGLPTILTCDANVGGKVSWGQRPTAATTHDYPNSIIYTFY